MVKISMNWKIVKKLMWEAFSRKTDFCWHCHTGIYSYPLRIALKFNIPLVLWGEPLAEMSAYYTYEDDEIEWENEEKFNMLRNLGITADDMHGMIDSEEDPVDKRDLIPYTYPSLEELQNIGYYSVCLGSFIPWDYKKHTKIIMDELGWEGDEMESAPSSVNKDFAKIECWMQGTRDYIKYLKRGYSRVTQIVNFEIREGRMSAEEGKRLIDKYDGNKPYSLELFLDYMNIDEDEFNQIVSKQIVPPHNPDIKKIPMGKKMSDFDDWYREKNTR